MLRKLEKKEDIMNKCGPNKIEHICEIDKLLKIYNLLILTQFETGNMNNIITTKEIESEGKHFPQRKCRLHWPIPIL